MSLPLLRSNLQSETFAAVIALGDAGEAQLAGILRTLNICGAPLNRSRLVRWPDLKLQLLKCQPSVLIQKCLTDWNGNSIQLIKSSRHTAVEHGINQSDTEPFA